MSEGPSKRAKVKYLMSMGWIVQRKRGEPLWFRDATGRELISLRVEGAYALQLKRDAHAAASDNLFAGKCGVPHPKWGYRCFHWAGHLDQGIPHATFSGEWQWTADGERTKEKGPAT